VKHAMIVPLLTALSASAAADDNNAQIMQTLQRWVQGYNEAGPKATTVTCADRGAVIGAFPPYFWGGVNACAHWAQDWEAYAKRNHLAQCRVDLGTPRHLDVSGDRAYVSLDAELKCNEPGGMRREPGWTWTVALEKAKDGWRIVGYSWGSPAGSAIKADR